MEEQVYRLLKNMLDLAGTEKDHLAFLHSFHRLLQDELSLSGSLLLLAIGDYFLKSTYQAPPDEYWYLRTNVITEKERFAKLAAIAEKEFGFDPDRDLRISIEEGNEPVGYIIIRQINTPGQRKRITFQLNEIRNFLYFVCKSLYRQFQLHERVKELRCLSSISKIADEEKYDTSEFLSAVVRILPEAWLYPEQARARIIYKDVSYCTDNFEESELRLRASFQVQNLKAGSIEINYPEGFLQPGDFPFLKEEEHLIGIIAQETGMILEKKKADGENEKLEMQLRHADRLATLGQLSAGIAHEINEPLAGILGLAQLMEKNESLNEEARNDLENIVSTSLHAREVVKKLMLFSRQMPAVQSRISLNDTIKNALFFLDSRCRKNMIELVIDLSHDNPEIIADSAQIHQVLVNLIVNALQAMPDGGRITVRTAVEKENVILDCSDTGMGMTREVLRQIFNPFFTTKKVSEGTGLGLSVVHGIIYSHNGEIKVSSKPGQGARFRIRLPLADRR